MSLKLEQQLDTETNDRNDLVKRLNSFKKFEELITNFKEKIKKETIEIDYLSSTELKNLNDLLKKLEIDSYTTEKNPIKVIPHTYNSDLPFSSG